MGTSEKQGIVSILRSDADQTKVPSLRRTLSADMSSNKWLGNTGISPMKKIASSEEITNLVADSSSSDEREDECDGKEEPEKPGQFDVWSSILLSKKADDESSKFPPYVHPLVKRSTSALSENSLKICTESLGSETGSEVFSSYASSLSHDPEEDKVDPQQQQPQPESLYFDMEELRVAKYNNSKTMAPKSFPPPLPSLAGCDGPALHMNSHRKNGRLVLEAVSIPSQNYFHAQRKDDRLVLTFANTHEGTIHQEEEEVIEHVVEEIEENFETIEDEKDCEDEEVEEEMVKVENEDGAKEIEFVMEQATMLPNGMINVHRSEFMIKKFMEDSRNPTWSNKYNKAVHFVDMDEEEEPNPQAKSLPRPPQLARLIPSPPAFFNTYEYFWRAKPIMATAVNPPNKNSCNRVILSNSTPEAYKERGMILLRGNKADYLVPLLRGCKDSRRSLLIWEPSCIATS